MNVKLMSSIPQSFCRFQLTKQYYIKQSHSLQFFKKAAISYFFIGGSGNVSITMYSSEIANYITQVNMSQRISTLIMTVPHLKASRGKLSILATWRVLGMLDSWSQLKVRQRWIKVRQSTVQQEKSLLHKTSRRRLYPTSPGSFYICYIQCLFSQFCQTTEKFFH